MNSSRTINFHIGAHKTATSYIQRVLRKNSDTLAHAGIKYIPLKETRKTITNRVESAIAGRFLNISGPLAARVIEKQLDKYFSDDYKTIVISDENISGTGREFYLSANLYPRLADRLNILKKATINYNINIFFSIRAYIDFFPAIYCEFLRHNDYIPFTEFFRHGTRDFSGWPGIIKTIESVFGNNNTYIWQYETFPEDMESIIERIISSRVTPLKYPRKIVRPSISAKAVDVIRNIHPSISLTAKKELVKYAISKYPKGPLYSGYTPWSREDQIRLSNRYTADARMIKESTLKFHCSPDIT